MQQLRHLLLHSPSEATAADAMATTFAPVHAENVVPPNTVSSLGRSSRIHKAPGYRKIISVNWPLPQSLLHPLLGIVLQVHLMTSLILLLPL